MRSSAGEQHSTDRIGAAGSRPIWVEPVAAGSLGALAVIASIELPHAMATHP